MIEHAKKSMTGYKTVPEEYAHIEGTHVIMTKQEYQNLLNEVSQANDNASRAKKDAADKIAKHEREAIEKYNKVVDQANETIRSLNASLAAANEDADYFQGLNENLLRIARERANADRKLKPKKEHTGYVVLSSTEKEQGYGVGKNRKTVRVWETVLQTPFSVDFTQAEARRQSREFHTKDQGGQWMIGRLGIDAVCFKSFSAMISENPDWEKRNIVFTKRMRGNYKGKYWEMTLTHTLPIGRVPEDMRP